MDWIELLIDLYDYGLKKWSMPNQRISIIKSYIQGTKGLEKDRGASLTSCMIWTVFSVKMITQNES